MEQVTARSRRSIDSLAVLNRKSCELAFDLNEIDWPRAVDRNKPWAPEGFSPIDYVPSYSLLNPAERLRCNQLQALSICEQFIWLERHVIRPLGRVLDGKDVPYPLREAMWHFMREEDKHIEMFWRLLERSEPEWYRSRTTRFFSVSPMQQFGIDCIVEYPRLLLAWIWLIIFVEERTLYIARRYTEITKESPAQIDHLHAEVHQLHLRDEARHYQLDQHVLTWLYDPQPDWKKTLCAWNFHYMMQRYVNPGRSARRLLRQLACEHPRLRQFIVPRLLDELKHVGRNKAFHQKHFSRAALPHTLALLAEYPEHDPLWKMFIVECKNPKGEKPE